VAPFQDGSRGRRKRSLASDCVIEYVDWNMCRDAFVSVLLAGTATVVSLFEKEVVQGPFEDLSPYRCCCPSCESCYSAKPLALPLTR
jgi:hypothetical protein